MIRGLLRSGALVIAISVVSAAAGSGQRRQVSWNNPDGAKAPGVIHSSFHSDAIRTEVGYCVALPEGYSAGNRRYPVVYFLHGAGGDENSDAGGFSALLAGLAGQKKIPPTICVFPNGGMGGYQDRPDQKVMVETLIVKELIPLVDRTYRTKKDRNGRVIAGLSMGGGGAVRLALKYPDLFSAAGSWAGALLTRPGVSRPETEPDHLRKLGGRVRLLLIVGDQDMTYGMNRALMDTLAQAKYPAETKVLPGVSHDLGAYYRQTGEEMARFLTEKF